MLSCTVFLKKGEKVFIVFPDKILIKANKKVQFTLLKNSGFFAGISILPEKNLPQ